ncbi:DUF1800 domain-containing protein [Massilia oculi]|uniref:DUF1800 domain-containing protein n=1 Tax=Massilia hydrophila TaxID=3044279 RepID=A0ABS7YA49_9BURK|nr:DUF1800 domain-containing protein [Massilia oculi]MCA1856570.1 DUF1800 domain-containing protein [Massilia oculi]
MTPESIALNRFGLGVQPADALPRDARRWLLAQLDGYEAVPAPWKALPRTPALAAAWAAQQRAVRAAPEDQRSGIREAYLRSGRQAYQAAVGARAASALQSATPFVERLVHFWANHFAVSVDKLLVIGLAGAFELDAIRPHVLGRFEDLLLAAVRHPAMLLYLDQARSTGPNSPAGRRAAMRRDGQAGGGGLNENLAREILELHTLGVRSGYSQADVTELARALTGWTLPGDEPADATPATFRFVAGLHEPGDRTVLGRSYASGGEEQARAVLRELAQAPATATHIATKLARHFVADDPPASLVRRLADSFARSGGDLPSLYRELVMAPEAWAPGPGKFKSPWEWTVSAMRALGRRELPPTQVANFMNQLGQPVWRPGSPAGWGDTASAWAAPDALLRRVELAQRLAAQSGAGVDARTLAPRILPGALGERTRTALARAESPATALALLLASPEFLRR